MRVVFLTHNYPRFDGDLAGGFLHPLARALQNRGVRVQVIAPAHAGQGGAATLDGIPVERVRYAAPRRETLAYTGRMREALRSPGGVVSFHGLWRSLRRAAARATADGDAVIHAHWWVPAGLAVPPGRRFVLTSHGTDVRLLEHQPLARWLARAVYRRAAVVTAVSTHLAEAITRYTGCPVPPERVQPMPVDASQWPFSSGGGGVLAVARLTPQKRLHLLIEAIAILRQQSGADVPCTIVGDGPARPSLERLARDQGVDRLVRFTGELAFPQVLDRLGRADLAVMPARAEGFGLAAAEALMAGVPIVICRDGGGLLDLADPAACRVVESEPRALAQGMADLLASGGTRTAAAQAGRRWRERLSPATVAARFESWYAEALNA